MRSHPWLRIFSPPQQERKVLLRQGPVARVFSPGVLRRQRPLVRQVPKKIVRFASAFPLPPSLSSYLHLLASVALCRIPVSILACLLRCRDPRPAVHFSSAGMAS